jgi:hypothetical protein
MDRPLHSVQCRPSASAPTARGRSSQIPAVPLSRAQDDHNSVGRWVDPVSLDEVAIYRHGLSHQVIYEVRTAMDGDERR